MRNLQVRHTLQRWLLVFLTTLLIGPAEAAPRKIVGYYTSWSIYNRNYSVEQIPANKLTHLNYAFARVAKNGSIEQIDASADSVNFPKLIQLKAKHPHLKTLISIGGAADSDGFSSMAANKKNRRRFVTSTVRFIRQHEFDGVDIDWEFPQAEEKENFTQLLAALRLGLDAAGREEGKSYELSIASGSSGYTLAGTDLEGIHHYLDHINLMAYDYHGLWSKTTNFNAPLDGSSDDPEDRPDDSHELWLEGSLRIYLNNLNNRSDDIVPREKLVVGMHFCGVGWGGVPDINHGLFQTAEGPASSGTWPSSKGSFDYQDLRENYAVAGSGFTRHWHPEAQVPWLYNPKSGVFIAYDDIESIGLKSDRIVQLGLGGAMFWELSADSDNNELVSVIQDRMASGAEEFNHRTEQSN